VAKIKEVSSEGFSQELKGFWFFCWMWVGDVMVCFEEGGRMVWLVGTSLSSFPRGFAATSSISDSSSDRFGAIVRTTASHITKVKFERID